MNFYVGMELRWPSTGSYWKLLELPHRSKFGHWVAKGVCVKSDYTYRIGFTIDLGFSGGDIPSLDRWEVIRDPFDVWVEEVRASHGL